jgi:hypothetical protein
VHVGQSAVRAPGGQWGGSGQGVAVGGSPRQSIDGAPVIGGQGGGIQWQRRGSGGRRRVRWGPAARGRQAGEEGRSIEKDGGSGRCSPMKVDSGVVQAKSSGASATTVDQREGEQIWCSRRLRKGVGGGEGKRGAVGGVE